MYEERTAQYSHWTPAVATESATGTGGMPLFEDGLDSVGQGFDPVVRLVSRLGRYIHKRVHISGVIILTVIGNIARDTAPGSGLLVDPVYRESLGFYPRSGPGDNGLTGFFLHVQFGLLA